MPGFGHFPAGAEPFGNQFSKEKRNRSQEITGEEESGTPELAGAVGQGSSHPPSPARARDGMVCIHFQLWKPPKREGKTFLDGLILTRAGKTELVSSSAEVWWQLGLTEAFGAGTNRLLFQGQGFQEEWLKKTPTFSLNFGHRLLVILLEHHRSTFSRISSGL